MATKAILNREFTTREKVLILILVVLVIIALYYFLVVKGTADTVASSEAEQDDLTVQIMTQKTLLANREKMQSELDSLGDLSQVPTIASYDNFRAEFNELNNILSSAASYNVTFGTPTVSNATVRRTASITFTTGSYDSALDLIEKLRACSFRCLMTDFSLTPKLSSSTGALESISGKVEMTIYETTVDATDLSGLESKSK